MSEFNVFCPTENGYYDADHEWGSIYEVSRISTSQYGYAMRYIYIQTLHDLIFSRELFSLVGGCQQHASNAVFDGNSQKYSVKVL